MSLFEYFVELSLFFFLSFSVLYCMRKVGYAVGLVDKPNARKHHEGVVPLVGGISLCITVLYFLYVNADEFNNVEIAAACLTVLVLIGVADDRFDISFKLRMGVQAILALIIMHYSGLTLSHVGDVFGLGVLDFPVVLDSIITVIAVIGAINAFNMVDGIDGLLGGLSIVVFASLGVLFYAHGLEFYTFFMAVMVVILLPFVLFNLGYFGKLRKVFMGDAGSMMIGFLVIWILIRGTQPEHGHYMIRPVTALWLIAVPLIDMMAIMIRRVRKGHSPFKPDREHFHHIMQRIGFTPRESLVVICLVQLLYSTLGLLGEYFQVPEYIMFYTIVVCFFLHTYAMTHSFKMAKIVRKWKKPAAK
ncbi:UDP-N-acetylglucosamine--undecaprenyl-phosphate N-acetylglucosaminephosphotransferase [Vibrio splendidus]|uniref:UDP-N-acetylglucosamine--undecaprenyl-phosphate N-acetylglucosaminephosphotransferase n=1 Tax=Vibrio splendidus TaxID=29497 RepID=UPI000C84BEA6|nr:UDP-N-acetylglucosamine--undecaprenyl-phosphate N-acetylglucosaminephosphotransferase [Vibrio splendidus]PMO94703.1 undecaprenyl-phosphate alpha-N-acetylglucosaminyl 1-phosphate transferase [Vibrio splendidus]PMP20155.1 undecaprenyl-phosphate alpha-N-acetylglucosaminyl 1-phosphate transferase [Vibrio splendidus]PMP36832.1 undecaprenyl-phosphate alpha-N-acetylglucosaminyl 1-phosphate transferase [Vibrio splendidus]PMP41721.1 undecaprenyl-phosphate alpha-N-acetylglucosaminyl 1-phosphate transf